MAASAGEGPTRAEANLALPMMLPSRELFMADRPLGRSVQSKSSPPSLFDGGSRCAACRAAAASFTRPSASGGTASRPEVARYAAGGIDIAAVPQG